MKKSFPYDGVLFDLDSTLLSSDRTLSALTIQTLSALSKQNIPFAACTGRNFSTIRTAVLPHFDARFPQITSTGGRVITISGEIQAQKCIPAGTVRQLLKATRGCTQFLHDLADTAVSQDVYQRFKAHVWQPPVSLIDYEKDYQVPQLSIGGITKPELTELQRQWSQLHWTIVHHKKDIYYADVTAPDVDKGWGVAQWSSLMKIKPERIVAFGNGTNDIPLFQAVGTSVAVANAIPKIKSLADKVTQSNNKSGPARFLVGLLEQESK